MFNVEISCSEEKILNELKHWLKDAISNCKGLEKDTVMGTEKVRLSVKGNTLKMVLGKIEELERDF